MNFQNVLELAFSRSNMKFAISQAKIVGLPWNKKANISIEFSATNVTIRFDLSYDLDLEFSRSNMEIVISQPKLSNCYVTKMKYINWTLHLKCAHWVWTWPWPCPWIFMIKYGICYISDKMAWLQWNNKQTYWLNPKPQMWASGLTLSMTLIGKSYWQKYV